MPIDQTLNNIPLATANVNVNNNKITNLTVGTDPNDAVCLSQLDGYIPVTGNINDLTAQTADYSTSGFQINNSAPPTSGDNLTNKTYVDNSISALSTVYQTIANMVNYVTNSSLSTILSSYVLSSFLVANYLTSTAIASTYQTIAEMSNFVTTTVFNNTLANYVTTTLLDF